jgi:cytochrome c biogenesis protein CcdA
MPVNNNAYVIAGILFIISLPVLLVWGVASIVQELRRRRRARRQGDLYTLDRTVLLAGVGAILFVLFSVVSASVYASILYHVFSPDLYWLAITFGVLAALAGVLYVWQFLPKNKSTASGQEPVPPLPYNDTL